MLRLVFFLMRIGVPLLRPIVKLEGIFWRLRLRMLKRRKEGDFFAIPLDGMFGFGRVRHDGFIAFYDLRAPRILPIEQIRDSPVLFYLGVAYDADRRWKIIGNAPLEDRLKQPLKFFREDPITKKVDIYLGGHEFVPVTDEDLTKLERLASWNAWHVEQRLESHFAGRPDPITENMKYGSTKWP